MTEEALPRKERYPFAPKEEYPEPGNTPGAGGYLLAVLLSWVFVSGGLALVEVATEVWPDFRVTSTDVEWLVVGPLLWGSVSGFFAVWTAPVGVVAVHLACRNIRHRWVHVLVTAVVGGLAVYAVALVFGESPRDWDKMAAGVGFCTAVGRAAVIPLVPAVRRRRLALHGVAT